MAMQGYEIKYITSIIRFKPNKQLQATHSTTPFLCMCRKLQLLHKNAT